ncbi:MAG TPA: RseA family anti-sigma factor [Pirellulaceae bacterium]|jgi:hypothetical protein|nr:RseA family anti-sigma factor [Pirellulaceae bacterium]
MERPSFDELISAYFDDETTPEESVVVERLLADPKHRQALEDYRQLRDDLRSMPAPPLKAEWSARLKQRLVTAKPDWAAKPDGAGSAAAVTPAPVASAAEIAASGSEGRPMPASLDLSRGDGYARFRHLWLTAGVGVAAGTLGIVIGWSAQNLSPGEVAYSPEAAVPMTASPAGTSEFAFEPTASLDAQREEALAAGAEADLAMADSVINEEGASVAAHARSLRDAGAPQFEAESLPQARSGELSGVESSPRFSRSNSFPRLPGPPLGTAGVADSEDDSLKKAEKQSAEAGGAMPPVTLAVEPSASQPENDVRLREIVPQFDESAARYTTYVGVWNPTSEQLSSDQLRGVERQIGALPDRALQGEDESLVQSADESLAGEIAPALVLDGSPEHVAEALEILGRGRSRGEVRLVERFEDVSERSRLVRARRLDEAEARSDGPVAASQRPFQRRNEGSKDEALERNAAGDAALNRLALLAEASPIDRIEAFFVDNAMARSSLAEGAAPYGMMAGGLPGSVSGGGGFGGGFGGMGGAAMPSASANGPAPAESAPWTESSAEAPPADAPVAGESKSDAGRGPAPPAAAPSARPAAAADLAQARDGASPAEPGAPPRSGAFGAATEPAASRLSVPQSAPAMAGQPVPPSPAPSPAPADNATPPPPAAVAAPSAAPDAAGAGRPLDKKNGTVEGVASGSRGVPLARGTPAEGEPEAAATASDEASSMARRGGGGREQEVAESKLAPESLQEAIERAVPEEEARIEGKLAPAPRRVRVILYAPERLLSRAAPAGAPATAVPAAESVPADSAPARDR